MKLRIFASLLSLSLFASAAGAATLTDTWSTAGGAWKPASQPQFASTGIINPDKGSDGGARLVNPDKQGLFETVFYTFFTAPTITVATDKVADGLRTISLELVVNKAFENGPTLNFNASHPKVAPSKVIEGKQSEIHGHVATQRTYVWDVASLGQSKGFSIEWSMGNHAAFDILKLVQSAGE